MSSTLSPRHLAYRRNVANGFVAIIDNGHPRIVLEGLHYTNEILPDLATGTLWVSETFGQRISRFSLNAKGEVGERTGFVRFPQGAFVDGIAADEDGVWAACIVSHEIFRIPPGTDRPELVAGERDSQWVEEVELALDAGAMGRTHFDKAPTKHRRNVSSLAFGGRNRETLLCGCLLGDKLFTLRTPFRGGQPPPWNVAVPDSGEPVQ